MGFDKKEIRCKERVAREIAKTSESIRKKHRALKTGKMEEEIELEKQLRPITEPLHKIAETALVKNEIKNEKQEEVEEKEVSTPKPPVQKMKRKRIDAPALSPLDSARIAKRIHSEPLQEHSDDDEVFENDPLESSIREMNVTAAGRRELQENLFQNLGPLGREYIGELIGGSKQMDHVYGVYFGDDGLMLGDSRFDMDKYDNIIINETRYEGTRGIYELIFKKVPRDTLYTNEDKQKYKSILLATNAHKRSHKTFNPIMGNRGYKYKHIIAPLMNKSYSFSGTGFPKDNTFNENSIDYVYWDDPNELVERLRLLHASRAAGNTNHDNEILSIIEELREAGLIIN